MAGVLILIAAALGEGVRDPRREDLVALAPEIEHPEGFIQPQSAQDDVSGPDQGRHVRTGHGDHVVAGRADGVRDVGGEIVLHPVHDAVDRYSQTNRPLEGDHREAVIQLVAKLGNVAVLG
ncbi:MAG TPA: hypothetical protein VFF52_15515, partial [Isosphaeraceae bacterium]|nr:hypothetical protein [Isosphaeraceae bacterium]